MAKKLIVVENNRWSFADAGLLGGFMDYNDTSTSSTPLTLTSNTWTTVPNDGLGPFTNLSYLPDGVTKLMDTTTGEFDFTELTPPEAVLIE